MDRDAAVLTAIVLVAAPVLLVGGGAYKAVKAALPFILCVGLTILAIAFVRLLWGRAGGPGAGPPVFASVASALSELLLCLVAWNLAAGSALHEAGSGMGSLFEPFAYLLVVVPALGFIAASGAALWTCVLGVLEGRRSAGALFCAAFLAVAAISYTALSLLGFPMAPFS